MVICIAELLTKILGYRANPIVFSNADGSSPTSVDIAARLAAKIGDSFCHSPPPGQQIDLAL